MRPFKMFFAFLLGLCFISFAGAYFNPQPVLFIPLKTVNIIASKLNTEIVVKKKLNKECFYIKNPDTGREYFIGCKSKAK
jgi:hypothetical protein